ncbi:hypothetical protein N7449_004990 [Penicillium cf. viridicatum]|uniref:Uncharacterized protein n=1 Tax=Penicillium cf. viridicatum TaxID=2972119 RepID=A0A9W9SYU4_9EURO|nr:hypothetical protein N7449_004990 [Penicillium cf. viridicatum]
MQKSGAGDSPNDLSQNEIMALVAPQKLNRKASRNRHSTTMHERKDRNSLPFFVPRLAHQNMCGHPIASFAAWKLETSILPDNVSDLSRLPLRYISCCGFLCSKSRTPLLIFMPLYIGAAIATVKHTCWEFYRRIGDKTKASLRRVLHRVFRLNLTALTP